MSFPKIRQTLHRGFTLVELMIVVVIIGVLAALAIYGVQKYLANAKSAEGRGVLGRIAKDAVGSSMGDLMNSDMIPLRGSREFKRRLCGEAVPVPAALSAVSSFPVVTPVTAPSEIQGKKYQSDQAEWSTGGADDGWQCLRTMVVGPQIYAYGYHSTVAHGAEPQKLDVGQRFTAYAVGDLDGDLDASVLWLSGDVVLDESSNINLRISPSIGEYKATE